MAYGPGSYNTEKASNYNYISTIDVHKPDVDPSLTRKYGSQLLTGLMDTVGNKVPVSAKEFIHYEDTRIMPKVKASIAVAGDVGTFTMLSNNSTSYTASSPYLIAGTPVTTTGYPVQKYDVVRIPGSSTSLGVDMQVMVTAVSLSGGTFTAQPLLTGQTIPTITGGNEIEMPVLYNATPEGAGQPNSLDTKVTKYTSNLMILKAKYEMTGTEANVQTWVTFTSDAPGPGGRVGNFWFLKGEGDTYKRFLNNREMALLLGQKITNAALITTLGFDGQQTQVTEGLIPQIQSNGIYLNYSSITGLTLSDLDTWIRSADKEKAAKENWVYNGINLRSQWSDLMIDITKEGGVSYGAFGGGAAGKDLALNLDFDAIKRTGYTFYLKTYDVFNDLQTLGSANFTFPDEAMIIPSGTSTDPQTKQEIQNLRVRYLTGQGPDGNRDMKHWMRNVEITNNDSTECNYLSEIGFEGFAMNRYGYVKKL